MMDGWGLARGGLWDNVYLCSAANRPAMEAGLRSLSFEVFVLYLPRPFYVVVAKITTVIFKISI